jgi:hypothetical protein
MSTGYQREHLICLRYLLIKIERGLHGVQVANLHQCKSQRDFDGLLERCSPEFASAPHDLAVALNGALSKIGLEIWEYDIGIID